MMAAERPLDLWSAEKIRGPLSAEKGQGLLNSPADDIPLSRPEIDVYTIRRLAETVRYVRANSVFYRGLFAGQEELELPADGRSTDPQTAEHPLDPQTMEHPLDPQTAADFMDRFHRLPFTYPADLQKRHMDFLCVHPSEISRIVTQQTSGSTGLPKRIFFTEADQELTVDFFDHGMRFIVDETDTVLILMPAKMPGSIGRLLGEGLRRLGARPIEYGIPGDPEQGKSLDEELQSILELMEREHVTSAVALPVHMRMLAQKNDRGLEMRSVLLSADYVPEEDCRSIEDSFGCRIYEHYGMTEMGLGCAVSCGQGRGYHIRETDLFIEIVDPASGEVITDETPGEIVFTTLTRKGMPFVRYRTGDISRWILQECPCGSMLRRLDKVQLRNVIKGMLAGASLAGRGY